MAKHHFQVEHSPLAFTREYFVNFLIVFAVMA
jgi:hypothetical protein